MAGLTKFPRLATASQVPSALIRVARITVHGSKANGSENASTAGGRKPGLHTPEMSPAKGVVFNADC